MPPINNRPLKYKIIIIVLIAIMSLGILLHSSVLYTLNKSFQPTELSYKATDSSVINTRLSLRQFSETVNGICTTIFFIGSIVMLYSFIKAGSAVAFHKLFLLFFATILPASIFAGAFAVMDKIYFMDHLFPLWSILAIVLLLFPLILVANFIKHIRE